MSKYVYDHTQKGTMEKFRETADFVFWCVMVGGGLGAVYAQRNYGGFKNCVIGFFVGMAIFSFFGVVKKIFVIK
jgi:uncharacterized membrane protein YjjP (DUF1212 family)